MREYRWWNDVHVWASIDTGIQLEGFEFLNLIRSQRLAARPIEIWSTLVTDTHYHPVAPCPHIFVQEKSWTCPNKNRPGRETDECA